MSGGYQRREKSEENENRGEEGEESWAGRVVQATDLFKKYFVLFYSSGPPLPLSDKTA